MCRNNLGRSHNKFLTGYDYLEVNDIAKCDKDIVENYSLQARELKTHEEQYSGKRA